MNCPCGRPADYAGCCGRFHSGLADAPTAEDVMRSRYSAFAVGDAAYLLRTWHTATRPESLELDGAIRWTGLQIIGTRDGGPHDKRGSVEFAAHYDRDGETGVQRENSSFRRQDGRWVYVAEVIR